MKQVEIEKKLKKIFIDILKVNSKNILNASQDNTKNWDSVNHMNLILEIENIFNISLSATDVVKLNNFYSIIKVINRKLN